MIASHRNSISTPYLQNNQSHNQSMNNMNTNNLRAVHTTEKRPSLQETSLQVRRNLFKKNFLIRQYAPIINIMIFFLQQLQKTLQRAYSAPRDHFVGHSANGANETTEPEINSRLESLCLRMTEQAIGGFGEA